MVLAGERIDKPMALPSRRMTKNHEPLIEITLPRCRDYLRARRQNPFFLEERQHLALRGSSRIRKNAVFRHRTSDDLARHRADLPVMVRMIRAATEQRSHGNQR